MNKLLLLFFILFYFVKRQNAQNLVPNPSFEFNNNCLSGALSNLLNWNLVCGGGGNSIYLSPCHGDPTFSTPLQYYDACFQSYQTVRTGISYITISNYVQSSTNETPIPFVKLTDTLKAGKMYCVTYYVSLLNYCNYSVDKLGALFTPTAFPIRDMSCNSSNTVAISGLYSPQVITTPGVAFEDTLNWMEVSGSFTAVGNEAYLAIGDFFTHAQHYIKNSYPTNCNGLAEYYVDDVSVEEVQIAKTRSDTLIYAGDSIIIGNNTSEAALFSWQPSAGLSCTNCPNPKASPSVTTTYTVTKTQCKVTTTDVVTITVSPTGINELNITNAITLQPNPTNGIVNISSRFEMQKIEILNIAGQVLLSEIVNDKSHQLSLNDFSVGIYFVRVIYPNGLSSTKKVVVNH